MPKRTLLVRSCLDCRMSITGTNWWRHKCTGPEYPIDTDEARILFSYYRNKMTTTPMELTFTELYSLVEQAGILPSQIGQGSTQYQLSRYNDTGPYALGNCRFITTVENIRERDSSASVANAAKARRVRDQNVKQRQKIKDAQSISIEEQHLEEGFRR